MGISQEQVNTLKKYDVIFRHADGVWCSPICMGHFWIVERVLKNDIVYCWVPDGYEVTSYHSNKISKQDLIDCQLCYEIVKAPYYSWRYMHEQEDNHLKMRYEQALKGQFWCPECGKWHELPLHELSEETKKRDWVVY